MRLSSRHARSYSVQRNRESPNGNEAAMETPKSQQATVSGFFGTPPEPIFNETKNAFPPDILQGALKQLSDSNEEELTRQESDNSKGHFRTGNPAVFIFELSTHFGLRPEVKYRAMELFHRFMVGHVRELYTHVHESRDGSSPLQWPDVESRLRHQLPLRAVSCVQLASKLSSHYNIVSVGKAKAFLASCGYRYATSSVVQSEVRVLKTLGFKVHRATPVDFVEAILETLGHNEPQIGVKQIHGVALKVLDVFLLARKCIFAKLATVFGASVKVDVLEADLMLLACALIAAAAFVLDQTKSDAILQFVSGITCISALDVRNFASVLLEEILSEEK